MGNKCWICRRKGATIETAKGWFHDVYLCVICNTIINLNSFNSVVNSLAEMYENECETYGYTTLEEKFQCLLELIVGKV